MSGKLAGRGGAALRWRPRVALRQGPRSPPTAVPRRAELQRCDGAHANWYRRLRRATHPGLYGTMRLSRPGA
eukprot:CAMPEP_0176004216 /NCGR_PEP_ID=MMETSP0120_2-20121206/1576_1 /TAXON_ID=160619 /ORGANISM="Kryptoperidinium foliaceum, Strain CCMP 1326" /LENGTH=71 /DNA_ID=CAMNT_0017336885 /DNA_START=131 /DNA_END=343 /DNA_ORIENTATION=+